MVPRAHFGEVPLDQIVNVAFVNRCVIWIVFTEFDYQCSKSIPVDKLPALLKGLDIERFNPIFSMTICGTVS